MIDRAANITVSPVANVGFHGVVTLNGRTVFDTGLVASQRIAAEVCGDFCEGATRTGRWPANRPNPLR